MRRCLLASIQVGFLCISAKVAIPLDAQQASHSNPQPSEVILGVLEDHPGNYSGEPHLRVVRAVFAKQGSEWRAFPSNCQNEACLKLLPSSYPQEVTWTIAFDGRNLGQVTAHTPIKFDFYADAGVEYIISAAVVPTVGKISTEFAGFLGEPVYRPLAAVSQPNFEDPEKWKPARLSREQVEAVRRQFRLKFPKVSNCLNSNEDTPKPWTYGNEDIEVSSTYSSKRGWSLVRLGLNGYACDGPEDDDSPFIGHWYVIDPSGASRLLGTGMIPIDAGDYDGDGKSEILFSVSGYNQGGYRLFYNDFSRSTEFLFSFH